LTVAETEGARTSRVHSRRDIGETSNEPTQVRRNEFEELYASANEELYPVCDSVTRLDFMEKFTHFKVKESYLMLTSLSHGPKTLGKDIDIYLRPLIDDLKDLWALKGVDTIDVATGQTFNMKAMLLWTINDFPARSSLSGLPIREKGKHPSYGGMKIKRNVLVELNWTKRSIFYELKYWSFLTLKHNLDVMHIKNVLESFLNTLLMNDKSKDTTKARQDLQNLGIQTKSEGSIAEGYVAKEALTFSSHYFRDVTTKFNRPDRNVDCPIPTCQFQTTTQLEGSQDVNHKKFSNGGVIVVEDDHDVIHFDNSSDLALSTSLNDLDFTTLNIDGQSMDIDAPPDIINVDEDDDFIDDEDVLPHDLADSDDEDLANDDDDDMSTDVARGHSGDGGGDDHPPSRQIFTGYRGTLLPLGDHATYMSNLLGEIVKEFPMHYPSWHKIKPEKKEGVMGTHRDEARVQYALDCRHVLAGEGRGIISPRCTHTDVDVDEVKEENKKLRKELNMLTKVVTVGSGNRSGGGGDAEPGEDEDADEDEDVDGSPRS
nr:hypothetical protein [Tanacetum cinerariifolium]